MSISVNVSNQPASTSVYANVTPYSHQNQLGKDDFLKLLTVQLANQDPSNPMDNSQMIAQMAQFSSLEQMTNLNTTMGQLALSQMSSNIGKEITWTDPSTNATSSGVVTAVGSQSGSNYYLVGSQQVPVAQVNEINQNTSA